MSDEQKTTPGLVEAANRAIDYLEVRARHSREDARFFEAEEVTRIAHALAAGLRESGSTLREATLEEVDKACGSYAVRETARLIGHLNRAGIRLVKEG